MEMYLFLSQDQMSYRAPGFQE
uniref:Uncharacterized protein n=1 Tax=Anguilla anguilla TaxID=7936 RepID=A0A0E9P732_ANGAN